MTLSGSRPATNSITRLSALLPGTMAGPDSPPLSNVSRLSMLRAPFVRPRPWHLMQLASMIGFISFAKSILWFAGGGRIFAWSGVILAYVTPSLHLSKATATIDESGKTRLIHRSNLTHRVYRKFFVTGLA